MDDLTSRTALRSLGTNLRYRDRQLIVEGRVEEAARRVGRRYRWVNRVVAAAGTVIIAAVLIQAVLGRVAWLGLAMAVCAAAAIAYTFRQQRQIRRVLDAALGKEPVGDSSD